MIFELKIMIFGDFLPQNPRFWGQKPRKSRKSIDRMVCYKNTPIYATKWRIYQPLSDLRALFLHARWSGGYFYPLFFTPFFPSVRSRDQKKGGILSVVSAEIFLASKTWLGPFFWKFAPKCTIFGPKIVILTPDPWLMGQGSKMTIFEPKMRHFWANFLDFLRFFPPKIDKNLDFYRFFDEKWSKKS